MVTFEGINLKSRAVMQVNSDKSVDFQSLKFVGKINAGVDFTPS